MTQQETQLGFGDLANQRFRAGYAEYYREPLFLYVSAPVEGKSSGFWGCWIIPVPLRLHSG
ncbi:hypothetical protein [Nostoc sp.]|uniref:hypothetical protein n=1 Tax=Nostoc sp. TaxID=1180 RepID=UPI002FFA660D